MHTNLPGFAIRLAESGLIPLEELERLSKDAAHKRISLIRAIITSQLVPHARLAESLSETFGLPLFDIDTLDVRHLPETTLDRRIITETRFIPIFQRGGIISVGITDPSDTESIDVLRLKLGSLVSLVLIEDDKLTRLLHNTTSTSGNQFSQEFGGDQSSFASADDNVSDFGQDIADDDSSDAPIVRFIQRTLLSAISEGASDIHFEPFEQSYRVRFRIDGVLNEVSSVPASVKETAAARIKVISNLDISEKRLPQDGRMRIAVSKDRNIDFRVSTLPTLFGEKIVMRILDPSSASVGIDALGYEPEQKKLLLDAIKAPHGMVLVTGPTGSGKTVSLYTCLNILNQPDINISTAEDPAEINLPGINQVNVNERIGLTFAAALRAFLRQDPDIIMVGEIRDLETAEISIKAAQTGHLVLSTLHTNDAPSTLNRLINIGIPAYHIANTVNLISAQRLVRRLCSCKIPLTLPDHALIEAGFTEQDVAEGLSIHGPGGCEKCKNSGYKGRAGIYQVMPITEVMQHIILAGGSVSEIATQAAKEGVLTMRQSGLIKIKQGMTTIDEVLLATER